MSNSCKALGKFTFYLDLEDVLLESVKAFVKDSVITISGNRAEVIEENNGMIRCNYRGFSKKFCLPQGTDPSTLKLTTPDGKTLVVELAYHGLPAPKLETSMLRNLLDTNCCDLTSTPFPTSWNRKQPHVGPASPMPNQASACGSCTKVVPRRSNISGAACASTAAVKPIRRVSFCHGDPSVSLYENQHNSLSAVYRGCRSYIRMSPESKLQRRYRATAHYESRQNVPSKCSAAIQFPCPNASSKLQATANASQWRNVGQSKV